MSSESTGKRLNKFQYFVSFEDLGKHKKTLEKRQMFVDFEHLGKPRGALEKMRVFVLWGPGNLKKTVAFRIRWALWESQKKHLKSCIVSSDLFGPSEPRKDAPTCVCRCSPLWGTSGDHNKRLQLCRSSCCGGGPRETSKNYRKTTLPLSKAPRTPKQ